MPSVNSRPRGHTMRTGQRTVDRPAQNPWARGNAGPQKLPRELSCGHVREFIVRPRKGDTVFCLGCDEYREAL